MQPKKYSAVYQYKDLEGLEKALVALHEVSRAFKDAHNFMPMLILYEKNEDDPLGQIGHVGIAFFSAAGPVRPIKLREHDKEVFDYDAYVQEG